MKLQKLVRCLLALPLCVGLVGQSSAILLDVTDDLVARYETVGTNPVGLSGSQVSSWNDQSSVGGTNNAVQATSTNQPILQTGVTPSGRDAIDFGGANDYLRLAATSALGSSGGPTALSWFLVFNTDQTSGVKVITGSNHTGSLVACGTAFSDNALLSYGRDASGNWRGVEEAPFTDTSDWHVLSGIWDTACDNGGGSFGKVTGRLDHVAIPVRSDAGNTPANMSLVSHINTTIGNDGYLDSARYFDGQLAAMLVYNTALSEADVASVENYLHDTYVAPAIIVNGDFESTAGWGAPGSTSPPYGWTTASPRKNAAGQQSGANAIGGSGTSAYMPSFPSGSNDTRREIVQGFATTDPFWQFDLDFASEDPGDVGSSYRSLSLGLPHSGGNGNGSIYVIVTDNGNQGDNLGDVQVYDGSDYYTPTGLANSVIFDDNVEVMPLEHHMRIVGDFAASGGPKWDLYVTDSNGVTHSALGLTGFYNNAPGPSDGIIQVAFNTFVSPADHVLDNISLINIPEPSTLVLLVGCLLCLVACRRRKRRL